MKTEKGEILNIMKNFLLKTLFFLITTWSYAQPNGYVSSVSGTPTTTEVGITQNYTFTFTPTPPSEFHAVTYEILYWTVEAQVSGNSIPGHINNIENNTVVSIFGNWEIINISNPKTINIPISFGNLANRDSKIKVHCYGKFYDANGFLVGIFNTVSRNFEHSVTVFKVNQPTISLTNQFLDCCNENVNICASQYGDANSFTWTVSGGTIATGQGSSCITVTPNVSGSITASCTVKRTTGLPNYTASNSKTFSRLSRSADFVALYPEFPNNSQPYEYICKGSGRQMQMSNQCGISNINWVANNCTITGQNTLTPTITPNNSVTTGSNISVYAVVSFTGGCTATTPTKTYKVLDGTLLAPQGNIILTSNTGVFCTAEIYELSFVNTNGYVNGETTISPNFIFGPGDEIHYRPGKKTKVNVCNKNNCTGQTSCAQYYVITPQPCYSERISESKVEISPNPALDHVNISLPEVLTGEIQIFDQNNFKVQNVIFNDTDELLLKLNTKLVSGIYIVKVITENQIFTEKLIVK